MRARPLDVILAEAQIEPDFLKLDTQGSEFEVLQGSTDALGQHIFGVLAETWIAEVHLGQHLSHDVMRLMADSAFNLIEAHQAARWATQSQALLRAKNRLIGMDLLFFRDVQTFLGSEPASTKVYKAAAIADVYGFVGYALELLRSAMTRDPERYCLARELEQIIIRRRRTRSILPRRIADVLQDGKLHFAKRDVRDFPGLHD